MSKTSKPTFETSVARLESIIEAMESGSAPLAELVAKFEEGSKLLKVCQEELKAAELKIEKLNPKTGETDHFDLSNSGE